MGVSCSNQKALKEKEDIIEEEHIKGRPRSLSKKELIKIFEQMEYSVYKIVKEKSTGTGFICRIPYPNELHKLPVLITCNHVLREEEIKIGKEIKLLLNETEKIIKIDEDRKVYTDKQYDITIIELKKEEYIIEHLLDVDSDITKDLDFNETYKNESIYILHYPEGKDIEYSLDTIYSIDVENVLINHLCTTKDGSSGGPILNLKTFKIIGIHIGRKKSKFNTGVLLKNPINIFNEKFPPEKKNEITLTLKVFHHHIKQKVYFLDNIDEDEKPHLEELNETNVKIYINDKEYKYCKYFIPENEGIYKITLKFDILMTDCSYMFYRCFLIFIIDFLSFDTSNVTKMDYMFCACENLTNLNLSSFDTRNVTSMKGMFNYCQNLKNVNLTSFDTRNVTDMSVMFNLSFNLNNLDLSSFDIENVTKMEGMFVPSINILTTFFLGGDLKVENNKTLKKIKVNKKSYEKFCKVIDKESLYIE